MVIANLLTADGGFNGIDFFRARAAVFVLVLPTPLQLLVPPLPHLGSPPPAAVAAAAFFAWLEFEYKNWLTHMLQVSLLCPMAVDRPPNTSMCE